MRRGRRAGTRLQLLELFQDDRVGLIQLAREHARRIAQERGRVTIDDVRDALGDRLPRWVDLRCLGAVFASPEFECIGYTKSRRSECHHRPIGVFRLREDRDGQMG